MSQFSTATGVGGREGGREGKSYYYSLSLLLLRADKKASLKREIFLTTFSFFVALFYLFFLQIHASAMASLQSEIDGLSSRLAAVTRERDQVRDSTNSKTV